MGTISAWILSGGGVYTFFKDGISAALLIGSVGVVGAVVGILAVVGVVIDSGADIGAVLSLGTMLFFRTTA